MNILYLLDQWPFPVISGARAHDKLMLKCLTEDWNATPVCWDDQSIRRPIGLPASHVLRHDKLGWSNILPAVLDMYLRDRPLHYTEFAGPHARRQLRSVVGDVEPDVIVLSSPDLACTVPYLKSMSGAKIVVDTHDIQLQRCQSILRSLRATDVTEVLRYLLLTRSYTLTEKYIYRDVDSAWVLKEEDKQLLASYESCKHIHVVPNVVDPDFVGELLPDESPAQEVPLAFVFVGKYDYLPNEQCALQLIEWFADGPLAAGHVPLYLIGVAPSDAMNRGARNLSNVLVTGSVPSLQEYLKPVDRIFIAPMLAGGGVKRKIIEAMAMGCPVLTTSVGAEGLELRSGETAEICGIDEFPRRALDLARDRERRARLAISGQRHILARFGYDKLQASVRSAIEHLFN